MERLDIIKDIAVKSRSADEWRRFTDHFDTYLIATEIMDKSETIKIALLKVLGGRIILGEYNNLFSQTPAESLEQAESALAKKFNAGESEHYRSHVFWTRSQNQNEKIDEWVNDLRRKAKDCKSKGEDRMIRDRIVSGVACNLTRRELLKQAKLSLQEALDICLAMESSQEQMKSFRAGGPSTMEAAAEDYNASEARYERERCLSVGTQCV